MVEPKVNRLFGVASPILNHPLTTLLPWVERAIYDDLPNPHSLVSGLTESIATNKAMMKIRGKRAFVISRSSFPSSGAHSGHWSGESCDWYCMHVYWIFHNAIVSTSQVWQNNNYGRSKPLASFPGLPRFILRFALSIIHGGERAQKQRSSASVYYTERKLKNERKWGRPGNKASKPLCQIKSILNLISDWPCKIICTDNWKEETIFVYYVIIFLHTTKTCD